MELAHAPVHFHSSDERFCGTKRQGRRFAPTQEGVTCPVCRAKDAAWLIKRGMKFYGIKWTRTEMACGTVRHTLLTTPYFVDHAYNRAHFTMGNPVGLYGSGMHESGCAAVLSSFKRVRDAKNKAEELAFAGK